MQVRRKAKYLFATCMLAICGLGIIGCSAPVPTNNQEESGHLVRLSPGIKLSSSDNNLGFSVQQLRQNEQDGIVYELLYQDQNGRMNKICDFDRWAEGAWSPESKYVMFNFHDESNTSTCKVFDTRRKEFVVDLRELLKSNAANDTWYSLFLNSDKMYVAGHSWKEEGTITFSVKGWGTETLGSYVAELEYNVIRGVTKISLCFSEEEPSGR